MSRSELPPLPQLTALSRLRVPADQSDRLRQQLAEALDSFESLQEIATGGVEASPYAVRLESVLRPDAPLEGTAQELPRGQRLVEEHAPRPDPAGYRVPRVIE